MTYLETYQQWLKAEWIDNETKKELTALTDPKEIEDRFYKNLEFGTGGLRGVMGAGTNRMNRYTIGKATLGFAHYLKKEHPKEWKRGVVIAYDSRNNSNNFALQTANILTACDIPVKLFRELEPTPVLSFAVKYHHAIAGIVITASHNPKDYNGYKVYDQYGDQIVPSVAGKVIQYINSVTDLSSIPFEGKDSLLTWIDQETVEAFVDAVQLQSIQQSNAGEVKIVYTPLHGAGNVPVRKILSRCGFSQVTVEKEQEQPDGDFSTVKSPNPEEKTALTLGLELAKKIGADIVIGTDPDSDRIGCGVKTAEGYKLLTGNQIGALLVDFVLSHRKLTPRSTIVKTIVTGELGAAVARSKGVQVVDTLTGFKYIGEKITEYQRIKEHDFVMGYEESYGYLVGTHAQDKDAVVAAMLICEMCACHKRQGKTLFDVLDELYRTHGYYLDALDSFTLKGKDGLERIKSMMTKLREQGHFEGVTKVKDYSQGIDGLPKENVMKFFCQDGSWFAVRPSGTEPKIKIYYSIRSEKERFAPSVLAEWRKRIGEFLDVIVTV